MVFVHEEKEFSVLSYCPVLFCVVSAIIFPFCVGSCFLYSIKFILDVILFRTCGCIFPSSRSSATLVVKILLYGMKPIFHMLSGQLRVPGFFLWSITHLRYDYLKMLPLDMPYAWFISIYFGFCKYPMSLVIAESLKYFLISLWLLIVFFRLWSTTGVYMLMFSLQILDILLTQVTQNTSLRQHLEGHIVWFFPSY